MKRFITLFFFSTLVLSSRAGTITDSFTTNHNYVTGGVANTIWDGVYLGAGEFANEGTFGPGTTAKCDANITAGGDLSIQTTGTSWENAGDDGFYLFKVVKGDFSATVQIVTPYNASAYNTAGLQARAYSAGGNPSSAGRENFVSWTRFDEYNYPNYLRNEVNGGVTPINPGNYPNSAYWLRMDRVGNNFNFYQKTNSGDPWTPVTFPAPVSGTNLTRTDLAGQSLEVGLIHADFSSSTLGVQFKNFTITATNFDPPVAPPSPASGLTVTNTGGNINIKWTAGSGSVGSTVVIWTGTNVIKEMPVNGTTYTGSANYGSGSMLLATNTSVVYSGTGNSVTVSNIVLPGSYNVAVYSYAGSGGTISYNHTTPPAAGFTIVPNIVSASVQTVGPDVWVTFVANIGEWYWLQSTPSLTPANWQNVLPGPTLSTGTPMTLIDSGGALGTQRYYRVVQLDPLFDLSFANNAVITGLQRDADVDKTQYMSGRLGDAYLSYRRTSVTNWTSAATSTGSGISATTYSVSPDGTQHTASYQMTGGLTGGPLALNSMFTLSQSNVLWTLTLTNLSSSTVEVGGLALPFPMNTSFTGQSSISNAVEKHHYIEGNGSFIFWMRPNSVGPYLLMTPEGNAKLEYWDVRNGFEAYLFSKTQAGTDATLNTSVTTAAQRWRQPNTSLMLAPGTTQSYTFKFQWANNYDSIRQDLVNEGSIDVHVVPGMTVPTNIPMTFALRTAQTINSVSAEFPGATQITYLGSTNVGANGIYQLYQAQFSQLGENELTINYGSSLTTYLECFVTEPIDTLIQKRAAYLVSHQNTDITKWYYGLYCDVNMNDGVTITPDDTDTLFNSFQCYEIAADDAGESRPAFIASKEALYPVQSEVSSLDLYIQPFVWGNGVTGGMQRTTNESSPYGIYGVTNWEELRTANSLNIGRGYDYPHFIVMYEGMYRVAKYHPEITTALAATNYLLRAYGTAIAMWNFGGGQATQVGLMNELVIPNLINELNAEGYTSQANTLKGLWETKVAYYVHGNADLFASEYAFDATGFESQQAYAKYADLNAGTDSTMGSGNVAAWRQSVTNYMNTQITANVFDRGWLETAYYYYGSDYRGDMGNDFVVTYMAAMGGWGLLDYAFYYAPNYSTNASDYLRLGMASYLCGWSTMNTGTPASGYGFWYPGAQYDGGCGGGFEPSPIESTWLGGQPMHRGAWYYSAEENLGFCGAIREAASALADDPIFGRYCYLGNWTTLGVTNEIVPLDGVRQRFHAMLNDSTLHLVLVNDRFAANEPIMCTDDQSYTSFMIESDVTSTHTATLDLTVSAPGTYTISNNHGVVLTQSLSPGTQYAISLPIDANATAQPFTITH